MIVVRKHVGKRKWNERASRIGASRKLRGLVTRVGSGQAAKGDEARICEEERTEALAELPGVVGDSAHGKVDRGTRETLLVELPKKETITLRRIRRESERPIVAKKQSNVCGAKGPY